MLNFTHMLVGAAIASQINPVLGLPLSFVSHFALDAIPHYDGLYPRKPYQILPVLQVVLDFMLGILLLATLTRGRADQSYLVISSLVAIAPDVQAGLFLNYQFLHFLEPLVDWHIKIQRKPPTWLGLATTLFVSIVAIWVLAL